MPLFLGLSAGYWLNVEKIAYLQERPKESGTVPTTFVFLDGGVKLDLQGEERKVLLRFVKANAVDEGGE